MKSAGRWITPIVCVLLLGFVVLRDRIGSFGGPTAAATATTTTGPEDTIYAMVDAGRNGDVDAWLALYTGQLATSLSASINERGKAEFSNYLKSTHAPMKGIAISQNEAISDNEARLKVEYVYTDRNDVQSVLVRKVDGSWKIERLDTAARIPTVIPYGTPVGASK